MICKPMDCKRTKRKFNRLLLDSCPPLRSLVLYSCGLLATWVFFQSECMSILKWMFHLVRFFLCFTIQVVFSLSLAFSSRSSALWSDVWCLITTPAYQKPQTINKLRVNVTLVCIHCFCSFCWWNRTLAHFFEWTSNMNINCKLYFPSLRCILLQTSIPLSFWNGVLRELKTQGIDDIMVLFAHLHFIWKWWP